MSPKLRRRLLISAAILGALFLIAIVIALLPGFQRWVVLGQLQKLDENAALERIHVTPFSAELKGLSLQIPEASVQLDSLEADISPWSLPFKHLNVESTTVSGLVVTVTPKEEAEDIEEDDASGSFPGPLALTETGFKLSLGEVKVDVALSLPGMETKIGLTGGGLAPGAVGTFQIEPLTLNIPEQEELRRVTVTGSVKLTEAERGAIDSIAWDLKAVAEGNLFEQETALLITGELEDGGQPNIVEDDDTVTYPPERILLTVAEPGRDSAPLFDLKSELKDNGQQFDATFTLAADNATLDPFALALDLPEFRGTGKGTLSLDLEKLTGKSTMELDADLTELQRLSEVLSGVGKLSVKETHEIDFSADEVVLNQFAIVVSQNEDTTVFDLATSYPLTFHTVDFNASLQGLKGDWLTLAVEVPLDWFDPLLGGFELKGGDLAGSLVFSGSPLEQLSIKAPKPLQVKGVQLYRDNVELLDRVSMQMTPMATVSPKQISLQVADLRIQAREQDLFNSRAEVTVDLTTPEGFRATLDAEAEAFARGIVQQEMEAEKTEGKASAFSAARRRIAAANEAMGQASLKMELKASAVPDSVTVDSVSVLLSELNSDEVLADAKLASPVTAVFDSETVSFKGLDGPWMEAQFTGMPVAVPAIFIDAAEVSGGKITGSFVLGANETPGGFTLNVNSPIRLDTVSVMMDETPLLKDADLSLQATVDYAPGQLDISGVDVSASSGGKTLLTGKASAKASLKKLTPTDISFQVSGQAGVNGLFEQPPLKPYLKKALKNELTASLETDGTTDLKSLELSKLKAVLKIDDTTQQSVFEATEPFKVTTFELNSLATALDAIQGGGSLSVESLPLVLATRFVDTGDLEITSGKLDTGFNWKIAEGAAQLDPQRDLVFSSVSVSQAKKPMLKNIAISSRPTVSLTGEAAELKLDALSLSADGGTPLVGDMNASASLTEEMPLQGLNARLQGPVTPWFRQPALPENTLSAGQLDAVAKVSNGGKATFSASLDGVAFKSKAPYIKSAYMEGSANIDPATPEYSATIPATLETADGKSDIKTHVTYALEEGKPSSTLVINGQTLRLGDVEFIAKEFSDIHHENFVRGRPSTVDNVTEAGSREKKEAYFQDQDKGREASMRVAEKDVEEAVDDVEEAIDEEPPEQINFAELSEETAEPKATDPDKEPFWKGMPRTVVGFRFEEVLYTGYVRFTEVAGDASVRPDHISLDSFSARFHDATMEGHGAVDWDASAMPKPYALEASSKVTDFDLSAFFGALVPGEKPRVEGLFRMDAKAEGSFPNLEQVRNFLTFALNLESTSGVFRAIPPNSGLMQSTSGTAAFFGEVLSYMPTSALGLGALSRLVSYMREVPYNRVALSIVRETDLNIRVEKLEVRSNQMLILGQGGILYEDGVDLLDQRLDLTASMDARGEFAAILSGLGLLTNKSAGNGYWRGFVFRIWGSLAQSKTNFDNIVTQASSGTLTRNVTNPFHGIWSNIKYSGDGPIDGSEVPEEETE